MPCLIVILFVLLLAASGCSLPAGDSQPSASDSSRGTVKAPTPIQPSAAAPVPTAAPVHTAARPTLTPLPPTRSQAAPSFTPALLTPVYASAFGIDYAHPMQYLAQGAQSRLADAGAFRSLRRERQSLSHLGEIYFWIQKEFTAYSAGGRTIGAVTVDQLMAEHQLGGCHDWGLVFASLARELGYPAVMVDTASIAWVKSVQAGQKGPYVGHVFVEVFVGGRWVLVDPTNNWYVETSYDPANQVIPLKGGISGSTGEIYGFYGLRKGVDTWGYGIRSAAELNRLMDDTARALKLDALNYPSYTFLRFK